MIPYYKLLILSTTFILTGCDAYTPKNSNFSKNLSLETSPKVLEEEIKGSYQKLDQSMAYEDLKTRKDILLIDVRTPAEFEEKRIPNSVLLPDYDIDTLAPDLLPDKEALIYLYCRSGARSHEAAIKLINMGYNNVYDMGGIINWQYETVSDINN